MSDENLPAEQPPEGEFLLYQTEDGQTRIECRFEGETIWLSQALMAELFQVTVPTVNEHLKTLYKGGRAVSKFWRGSDLRKKSDLGGIRDFAQNVRRY